MRLVDLTGHVFGRLTVIKYAGAGRWCCRCNCGRMSMPYGKTLKNGTTRSCGCLSVELAGARKRAASKNRKQDKAYRAWQGIKQRCYNKKSHLYAAYGGRGLTMEVAWRTSFAAFLAEVGQPPTPEHSIDRIDNRKGYTSGNVRWATAKQQSNNKDNNVKLTVDGKTQTLGEWADEVHIEIETLRHRLWAGWSDAAIVMTPLGQRTPGGMNLITVVCLYCKTKFERLQFRETSRIKHGWNGPFCSHSCTNFWYKGRKRWSVRQCEF